MTAVLPESRPASSGRHRAPDDATTGSMGVVPADRRSRDAHGSHRTVAAPLQRAARTAGLSLAALGALATAGGVATHGFTGEDDAARTGEVALPTDLASADMAVRPAAAPVSAPAVMPVAAPAAVSAPQMPQIKTVSAASKAAARADSAARAESDAKKAADDEAAAAKADADEADTDKAAAGSSAGQQAVAAAKDQLGKPYEWGATGPSSFDCSGLMQWAYEKAGKELPRTSKAQAQEGQEVSADELQPGDLVYFYSPVSHIAMYAGDGMVVEAPTEGQDVKMTKLSKIEKNMVGARRL